MSAIVPSSGPVRQLDGSATPDERVTEQQVGDPSKLARVLMTLLGDVARLKRRWWPEDIYFAPRAVDGTGTTKYRFEHRLGASVNWSPTDWQGAAGYQLSRHNDSDLNTLVLVSYSAGMVAIRVEVAG